MSVRKKAERKDSINLIFKKSLRQLLLVFITLLAATGTAACQQYSSDVKWLIDVLELKEGSVVADIGAGDGDQTLAVARYVGPDGHVYSSELGSQSLNELRDEIDEADVDNVTVVEGHPDRTNLPAECCDALYLRRVYHHITDPPTFNRSVLESLKPGGRLALIEFEPRGSEANPGGRDSGSSHGVTAETMISELTEAGFELVSSDRRSGRNIYVVVEKPGEESE